MVNHNKKQFIALIFIFSFSLLFVFLVYKQLFIKGILLRGDTIFHAQRLLEIRYAFSHRELPNWLNFHTFLGMGQAINGMYPDITLWPFVIVTNFLPANYQILTINLLILGLTLIVTTYSLYTNLKLDKYTSLYFGIAFTFSGYSLYQCVEEMQPGTGIILIFTVPIFFSLKRLIITSSIDIKVIIQFALCITLIMYSHLLSIVVFFFILFGIFTYLIVKRSLHFNIILNVIFGGILSVVTSLPIIYRYCSISRSGIIKPFGEGNIQAMSLFSFIKDCGEWASRESLSGLSLICLLIIVTFINRSTWPKLFPLFLIEGWICLLCTNIMPWKLFNKIPFINNLQYTPWRFGIWTSFVPILMLIILFNSNKFLQKKVAFIIAVISLIIACVVVQDTSKTSYLRLNSNSAKLLTVVKSRYSQKDRYLLNFVPRIDYYPDVNNVVNNDEYMTSGRQNYIFNSTINLNKKTFAISKRDINNGISMRVKENIYNQKGHFMQLPIIGYKSLNYHVSINKQNYPYRINNDGYLEIKPRKLSRDSTITIKYHNPNIYNYLVLVSITITAILMMLLFFK